MPYAIIGRESPTVTVGNLQSRQQAEETLRRERLNQIQQQDIIEYQNEQELASYVASRTPIRPTPDRGRPISTSQAVVDTQTGQNVAYNQSTQYQQLQNLNRAIAEGRIRPSQYSTVAQQIQAPEAFKQENIRRDRGSAEAAINQSRGNAGQIIATYRNLPSNTAYSYQTTENLRRLAEQSQANSRADFEAQKAIILNALNKKGGEYDLARSFSILDNNSYSNLPNRIVSISQAEKEASIQRRVEALEKSQYEYQTSPGFQRIGQVANVLTGGIRRSKLRGELEIIPIEQRGFAGQTAQMVVRNIIGFPEALAGAAYYGGGKLAAYGEILYNVPETRSAKAIGSEIVSPFFDKRLYQTYDVRTAEGAANIITAAIFALGPAANVARGEQPVPTGVLANAPKPTNIFRKIPQYLKKQFNPRYVDYQQSGVRVVEGVTDPAILSELLRFQGKTADTAHATLSNQLKYGSTLEPGPPGSVGPFRNAIEQYNFYQSLPKGDKVLVYGGYIGIGDAYSGGVKPMFTILNPTPKAFIFRDQPISPTPRGVIKQGIRETVKYQTTEPGTYIPAENLFMKSIERQAASSVGERGTPIYKVEKNPEGPLENKFTYYNQKQPTPKVLGTLPSPLQKVYDFFTSKNIRIEFKEGKLSKIGESSQGATKNSLNLQEYSQSYGKTKSVTPSRIAKDYGSLSLSSVASKTPLLNSVTFQEEEPSSSSSEIESPSPSPSVSPIYSPSPSYSESPSESPSPSSSPSPSISPSPSPSPSPSESPSLSESFSPSPSSSISPSFSSSPSSSSSPSPSFFPGGSPRSQSPPSQEKYNFSSKKSGSMGISKGFDVLLKRKLAKKGKGSYLSRGYIKLNQQALSEEAAAGLGMIEADKYANRSLIVVPSEGAAQDRPDLEAAYRRLAGKFRPSKKNPRIFVEKETFAIDSFEEKKAIPYEALRSRKGMKAARFISREISKAPKAPPKKNVLGRSKSPRKKKSKQMRFLV